MDKTELALETFRSNFNCAQSVFSAFSEDYGLQREQALLISSGFGGGLRCGEVCGAASGAVMVIGLCHGQAISGDIESKELCNSDTTEFMHRFRQNQSSYLCRDILGIDISEPDNRAKAKELNLFNTLCVEAIKSAVSILEDMGY